MDFEAKSTHHLGGLLPLNMRGVHALIMVLLQLGMRLASGFGHVKARKAWRGRKGWAQRLIEAKGRAVKNGKTRPWMHVHCASLGEYEQAAPVIDALKRRAPSHPILLTFFSPSGMDAVPASVADHVDYLPWDTAKAMRKFQAILRPSDTLLVKYELWPELILSASKSGANVHLFAARFDRKRHPTSHLGFWARRHLRMLTTIQVQDESSAQVLQAYHLQSTVTGDPRLDRVLQTAREPHDIETARRLSQFKQWKGNRQMLIVGSAWTHEWDALLPAFQTDQNSKWCVLVAPHEVHGPHIAAWSKQSAFPRTSLHQDGDIPASAGLLLDEVGLLKYAYSLGDIAVVGGGWEAGVHNTLEPAVFGLPIATGPNVGGFREIQALAQLHALQVCADESELQHCLADWMNPRNTNDLSLAGQTAQKWVESHAGATERIADAIAAHAAWKKA